MKRWNGWLVYRLARALCVERKRSSEWRDLYDIALNRNVELRRQQVKK
jgi:hypothetical protein